MYLDVTFIYIFVKQQIKYNQPTSTALCWVHLSEHLSEGSDECQASNRLYENTLLHRPVQ